MHIYVVWRTKYMSRMTIKYIWRYDGGPVYCLKLSCSLLAIAMLLLFNFHKYVSLNLKIWTMLLLLVCVLLPMDDLCFFSVWNSSSRLGINRESRPRCFGAPATYPISLEASSRVVVLPPCQPWWSSCVVCPPSAATVAESKK